MTDEFSAFIPMLWSGDPSERRQAARVLAEFLGKVARAYLGSFANGDNVDDVVQQSVLKIIQSGRFDRTQPGKPYLRATVRREAQNLIGKLVRVRATSTGLDDSHIARESDPLSRVAQHETIQSLTSALDELPGDQRLAICAFYLMEGEKRTIRGAARAMGVAYSTFYRWLKDGMLYLAERVAHEEA